MSMDEKWKLIESSGSIINDIPELQNLTDRYLELSKTLRAIGQFELSAECCKMTGKFLDNIECLINLSKEIHKTIEEA